MPRQYEVYDEQSLTELLAKSLHDVAVYELTHIFSVAEFPGYMIRVFDDGVLMNRAAQPTVVVGTGYGDYEVPAVASAQDVVDALLDSHFVLIAARDLEAGDEVTLDYNADPETPCTTTPCVDSMGCRGSGYNLAEQATGRAMCYTGDTFITSAGGVLILN